MAAIGAPPVLSRAGPGAERLRDSRVFRNTFRERSKGVAGFDAPQTCLGPTTPSGVSKDCCETPLTAPARHTRLRTTTRAADHPRLLPPR
jgi:hypothetical protein